LGDEPACAACGYTAPAHAARRGARGRGAEATASWQQTSWGKIFIGLLLSAGIFYGLMQLFIAVLVATQGEPARDEWLKSLAGLLILQAFQLLSLLIGGMMAGAGHQRGTLYGSIVGVYNALLFLLVWVTILKNELPPGGLIGLPLLQVAFGTLGGYVGSTIWKPIQVVSAQQPAEEDKAGEPLVQVRATRRAAGGAAISWVRVLTGTAVACAGTLGANAILKFLEMHSLPGGGLDTMRQTQFLTWEIFVLAVLVGAAIAGSNAPNGMKPGVLMGVLTSFVLALYYVYRAEGGTDTTAALGFSLLGLDQSRMAQKIIFTFLSIVPLGLAGGWFGSQLLPPVVIPRGRRHLISGMS